MDWRVLLTTFGIIFLAEMGDKTQLAAMTMAADKKRPWEVFLGASLALVAVSAVGILVGTALGHYLPLDWIKRVAGVAFVMIGVLILLGSLKSILHLASDIFHLLFTTWLFTALAAELCETCEQK